MRETDLYQPIKTFLEGQGYEVKAEVKDCDVVACRGDEPPVIVELKTSLSMTLLLQAVDRQVISDWVYVAFPRGKTRAAYNRLKDAVKLCKRLGVGVITVRLLDGTVEVHCDPAQYQPRKMPKRKSALLQEFQKRDGDPNIGGSVGKQIMTAYRQDAMKIREFITKNGPSAPKVITRELGIPKAGAMLQNNHYGWFFRVERGVYDVSEKD